MSTVEHGQDQAPDTAPGTAPGTAPDVEPLHTALARLPSVDAVLRHRDAAEPIAAHGRGQVTTLVRAALDEARDRVRAGEAPPSAEAVLAAAVERLAQDAAGDMTGVINATGVVLHTNLGRAPLSAAARRAVADAAGYTTVEYHLDAGTRGSRTSHLGSLAARLCAAPAATVVNNGAAALLLAVAALASGRDVVVSRGELIEIGGSFRLPDLIPAAGARLVEVGTANRTRVDDYARALRERDTAGLLLKVHRANHRVIGFTEEATLAQLRELAAEHDLPLVHDLGSGLIRGTYEGVLATEPSVQATLEAGADLVTFSGDKLLGGPQAGILAGRADLVERCRTHPLARAVRVDKLQRAAMEATLHAHLRDEVPLDVPTVAMLTARPADLRARADAIVAALPGPVAGSATVRTVELQAAVGGGALPGVDLPSAGLGIEVGDPTALATRLRRATPPVIVRVEDGQVLLDLRTVAPSDDDVLTTALRTALT